jgi:hypothetical protein
MSYDPETEGTIINWDWIHEGEKLGTFTTDLEEWEYSSNETSSTIAVLVFEEKFFQAPSTYFQTLQDAGFEPTTVKATHISITFPEKLKGEYTIYPYARIHASDIDEDEDERESHEIISDDENESGEEADKINEN